MNRDWNKLNWLLKLLNLTLKLPKFNNKENMRTKSWKLKPKLKKRRLLQMPKPKLLLPLCQLKLKDWNKEVEYWKIILNYHNWKHWNYHLRHSMMPIIWLFHLKLLKEWWWMEWCTNSHTIRNKPNKMRKRMSRQIKFLKTDICEKKLIVSPFITIYS